MDNANAITVFEENMSGHDIIAGDVHGEITLLAHMVQNLGPNDRLFIVGDLVDRGEDSLAIFKFINGFNTQQDKPKIITIKGNHEVMLLNFIDSRLNPENYSVEKNQEIVDLYRINGGGWAMKLPLDELKVLKTLIEPSPYIIHVKGQKPFHIAHADMLFTDKELLERIENKNFKMTAAEIEYCVWARNNGEVQIKETGRTSASIPVYCGHSILEGMRADTKHINLDFGSFGTHHIGIVNHTTDNCVTYTTSDKLNKRALAIIADIKTQLKSEANTIPARGVDKFQDNMMGLAKNDIQILVRNASAKEWVEPDWDLLKSDYRELTQLIKTLSVSQAEKVFNTLANDLPAFSGNGLSALLADLLLFSEPVQKILINKLDDNFSNYYFTYKELITTLKLLPEESRMTLVTPLINKISHHIDNADKLAPLLDLLPGSGQDLVISRLNNFFGINVSSSAMIVTQLAGSRENAIDALKEYMTQAGSKKDFAREIVMDFEEESATPPPVDYADESDFHMETEIPPPPLPDDDIPPPPDFDDNDEPPPPSPHFEDAESESIAHFNKK
jgi:hypothetical protein